MERLNQRPVDGLRPLEFITDVAPNALASVLSCFGNTRVICAVSIEEDVPRWMKSQRVPGGWLTAEYAMLPYSTAERKRRDSAGKQDGRSVEIQRLIGRSLRAVMNLEALGERTVYIDCDVLQADGGTRTASITGAAIALAIAMKRLMARGSITENPMLKLVSAVSVTSSGALEGLGKGAHSLVISLCRYAAVILPAALLLCRLLGPEGVWHAFWITEVLTAGAAFWVYRRASA